MAITSFGYPGTIDAKTQAVWLPMVSSAQYSVAGAGDLRVTARTAVDRGITVAAGTAAGDGVMDILSTAELAVIPSVAGTNVSRWFMVALRRNWNTNASSIVVVAGSATRALPTRTNDPGGISDQPLALVRVESGKTTISEFVDLRTWARSGGVYARDELVKDFLTEIGTSLLVGSTRWERVLNASLAPTWRKATPGGAIAYNHADWEANRILPVSTSPNGSQIVLARFTIPDPGFPYITQVVSTFESGAAAGTRWDATVVSSKGGLMADARGGDLAWYSLSGFSGLCTGSSVVDLNIGRVSGTSAFLLSPYKRRFALAIFPAL